LLERKKRLLFGARKGCTLPRLSEVNTVTRMPNLIVVSMKDKTVPYCR